MQSSSNSFQALLEPYDQSELVRSTQDAKISKKISNSFEKMIGKYSCACPFLVLCLLSPNKQNNSKEWYRALLLQIYSDDSEHQTYLAIPSFCNKIQYSLSHRSQSQNWMYLETLLSEEIKQLNYVLGVLSSTIIVFEEDLEYYKELIKNICKGKSEMQAAPAIRIYSLVKKVKVETYGSSQSSSFCDIFVNDSETMTSDSQLGKLRGTKIYIGNQSKLALVQTQSLQQLINAGRSLIKSLPQLKISPQILIHLLKNSLQNHEIQSQSLTQQITEISDHQATSIADQYRIKYQQKLRSQCRNQQQSPPIILKQLYQYHMNFQQQITRTIPPQHSNTQILQKITKSITDCFTSFLEQVLEHNSQQLIQYLTKELKKIRDRVISRQIKKLSILQQQMNNFRNYFNKKIQQFFSLEGQSMPGSFLGVSTINANESKIGAESVLIQEQNKIEGIQSNFQKCVYFYFKNFTMETNEHILNSIYTNTSTLLTNIQSQSEKQLQATKSHYQQQASLLQLTNKSLTKQINQLTHLNKHLSQNYVSIQKHEELLEKTISQLREQVNALQNNQQKNRNQCQQKYFKEMSEYQQSIQELSEQLHAARREVTVLESEIQKQKILHEHSITHYETLLSEHKITQNSLYQKVQQLSQQNIQSQLDLASYRKQIQENTSIFMSRVEEKEDKNYSKKQIERLLASQQVLDNKYNDLVKKNQIQKEEYLNTIQNLEQSNRNLENKLIQYETLLIKNNNLVEQFAQLQETLSRQLAARRNHEKEIALLQQENQFLTQTNTNLRQKYTQYSDELLKLEGQLVQIKQKQKLSKKNKVDEWTQTQENILEQHKLRQALKIVQILEQEYNRVKGLLEKYQRKEKYRQIDGNYSRKIL